MSSFNLTHEWKGSQKPFEGTFGHDPSLNYSNKLLPSWNAQSQFGRGLEGFGGGSIGGPEKSLKDIFNERMAQKIP